MRICGDDQSSFPEFSCTELNGAHSTKFEDVRQFSLFTHFVRHEVSKDKHFKFGQVSVLTVTQGQASTHLEKLQGLYNFFVVIRKFDSYESTNQYLSKLVSTVPDNKLRFFFIH